jgi:Ca-activated chloride channel family protein
VTSTGRTLPLLGAALAADAAGGVARVTVEQWFRNPYAEPLAVTYSLPLPADGAVSGFSFRVGARRVVGEVDRREEARERYEEALAEGKSAALLEQDRSSLFTQEIGNIPPGEVVVVEVVVDQRLRWLDEGAWEWRFPTVAAPRYLGEAGRVPDADRVVQDVADAPLPGRLSLSCAIRDAIGEGRRPESPSHAIDVYLAGGIARVELREPDGARLDRDVVVRWTVATAKVGVSLVTSRPVGRSSYGLLTIVPPWTEGAYRRVPRDLIVLIDTSGSMSGEPLAQAARVVSAIVATLRDEDQLELIEFGSEPRRWRARPVSATEATRRDAIAWLHALRASGATEMRTAIVEALPAWRDGAQRQVVLVTDGLIGFESQVVKAICDRLPRSSRLHTVGVGSSVNRSLTGPAARAGHGVEVVIGLGEDPERAAALIVARTTAPLLVDLAIDGSALVEHAPSRLPDLFAGSPALVGVALRPEGGELVVRGRTLEGTWEQRLRVAPVAEGGSGAPAALFAREAVEDLEMRLAAGGAAREIDAAIERLGIDFQIATRLTSWVAVSQEQTVDPGDPLRRVRMPHELPHRMSAEGLGLRPAQGAALGAKQLRSAAPASEGRMRGRVYDPRAAAPRGGGYGGGGYAPGGAGRAGGRPGGRGGAALSGPARPPKAPEPPQPKRELENDFGSVKRKAPSEPAQAKVVEKGSFTGKVTKTLVFLADDGRTPLAPARRLRGRVVLYRDRELVIEILVELEPSLPWNPAGEVTVGFAGGLAAVAIVDHARSTHAGVTVAPGASARIALTLPEGSPPDVVAAIALMMDGDLVLIEV